MRTAPQRRIPNFLLQKVQTTCIVVALVALPAWSLSAARTAGTTSGEQAAAESAAWRSQQQAAVRDLRSVGTAMWVWYKTEMAPRKSRRDAASQPAPTSVDLAGIPVITPAALEKVLVPKYIASLPKSDPWGHPYEYRLNTEDPDAQRIMAVRSAGADGRFSGDSYEIGAFPPADPSQDLVWVDGYFARWPQPAR
jgi:Type II secretion system (T2SS), protein G